jgi:hypothetical protein
MLETTRVAQFPMVAVRAKISEEFNTASTIYADLEMRLLPSRVPDS